MNTKTPEEFQTLFAEIAKKHRSADSDVQASFASKEFCEVVEGLIDQFQDEQPGMRAMIGYAKAHGFDQLAIAGIWIALGVSAATPGPRQRGYLSQAADLASDVLIAEGFGRNIDEMKSAFQRLRIGHDHTLHSLASKQFKHDIEVLLDGPPSPIEPATPVDPFLGSPGMRAYSTHMARTTEEHEGIFSSIHNRVSAAKKAGDDSLRDGDFKMIVASIHYEFWTACASIIDVSRFSYKHQLSENAQNGIWNALGIAAATPGQRQSQWISLAKDYCTDRYIGKLKDAGVKAIKDGFALTYDENQIKELAPHSDLYRFHEAILAPHIDRDVPFGPRGRYPRVETPGSDL